MPTFQAVLFAFDAIPRFFCGHILSIDISRCTNISACSWFPAYIRYSRCCWSYIQYFLWQKKRSVSVVHVWNIYSNGVIIYFFVTTSKNTQISVPYNYDSKCASKSTHFLDTFNTNQYCHDEEKHMFTKCFSNFCVRKSDMVRILWYFSMNKTRFSKNLTFSSKLAAPLPTHQICTQSTHSNPILLTKGNSFSHISIYGLLLTIKNIYIRS